MSAQASLMGIEEPAETGVEAVIVGQLVRHAELRHATDGSLLLHAEVAQHLQGHPHAAPVITCIRIDPSDAPNAVHQVWHHKVAHELRAGVEVLLRGKGLEITTAHGAPAVRLINCRHIALVTWGERGPISAGGVHAHR